MKVKCPACHLSLQIDDQYAGMQAACPRCRSTMVLPALPPPVLPMAELLPDDPPPPPPPPVRTVARPAPPPPPPPVRTVTRPAPPPPPVAPPTPAAPAALFSSNCPQCHHPSRLRIEYLGRKAACKKCGFKFVLQPDLDGSPAFSFRESSKLSFPKFCVGCLAPDPSETLDVRTDPETTPPPATTGGSTAGAVIGGIIGGILFGEVGAALGAAAGGGGGAVAANAASAATGGSMPICETCLERLSADDAAAFGEGMRGVARVRIPQVLRTWVDGEITFRFAHESYGEAFREANPMVVTEGGTAPRKEYAAAPPGTFLLADPPGGLPEFVRTVLDMLMPHNKAAGWFRDEQIPEKKLTNALAEYAEHVSPNRVLGLADETVFGNGKAGFLIHEHGLCYSAQGNAGRVVWDEIARADFTGGFLTSTASIKTHDGKTRTVCCAAPCKAVIEAFAKFLNQVALYHAEQRDADRPAAAAPAPTATAAAPEAVEVPDENVPKWKRKMGTAVGTGAPTIGPRVKAATPRGPRCPKCEFSTWWNGIRCTHCGHTA